MRGSLVLGTLLLVVGAWWIVDLAGIEVPPGGLGTWWPMIIVAWAATRYVVRPKWRIGPLVIMATAGLIQADKLGYLPQGALAYVIPLMLVMMGIAILVGMQRMKRRQRETGAAYVRAYRFGGAAAPPPHRAPRGDDPDVIDVPPRGGA